MPQLKLNVCDLITHHGEDGSLVNAPNFEPHFLVLEKKPESENSEVRTYKE